MVYTDNGSLTYVKGQNASKIIFPGWVAIGKCRFHTHSVIERNRHGVVLRQRKSSNRRIITNTDVVNRHRTCRVTTAR